jgi:hypothetical protein
LPGVPPPGFSALPRALAHFGDVPMYYVWAGLLLLVLCLIAAALKVFKKP